ncbi:DUF2187 family protein [Alkalihalobacillus sp. LMS39]|uniref:DUF2187 family protein n=1 Tax=Alkalihalobacillus sp. LMS39 TaxID=2924032 RepID=UPI001FB3AE1C|nr:DUF2187 family protein [Alkalihalobacillus sp. LMS39]UOE92018.1 DUF2187 family protein [Alkalihalobacillus sp. LMS39]
MSEEQPIMSEVQIGDIVSIIKGTEKGKDGKVIAVYTNSVVVELERREKNGLPARTVINHSKYSVKS